MLRHHALADLACRSYSDPQTGRVRLDLSYEIEKRHDELVIVMPGTHPDDPLNWLADISLWPVWLRKIGLVHSGFGEGAAEIWRKIKFDLPSDRLITVTGHSLGGALAQGIAAHISYWRPDLRFRVVTFGAPRISFMNPWFGALVRRAIEAPEYQRDGDIVPDVPFRPPYGHPTRPQRIGTPAGDLITDHSIALYRRNLAALKL